jgi:hypothetical protein
VIEYGEEVVETTVAIVFDRTPFGERPWLECSQCGSRRKDLFLHERALRCRRCARLLYHAQRLSDSTWRRDVALPLLRASRHTVMNS